jgi:hypothetical protein
MVPSKPPLDFKFWFFFSATPSPLLTINLNLVNVETFSTSPNSDLLKTLSKGKHKASNIVVFQGNSTSLVEQGECNKPKKKKHKLEWEVNHMFHVHWVAKFCWSKPICGIDGKMKMVRCKVCSIVERREKLLMPKLDYLVKHFRV